ncbi:MAG: Rieske 2Fe-2S domain-containing protein [Burkholderiaceae bacterium]
MLENHWYVGSASSQLGEAPKAIAVMDQRIVLYRGADGGAPHALEDRCCHRGVPLSIGKVVDQNIACGYHGWQYDGAGRCVHVPSLCAGAAIPSGFKVRSFPCVEQDHYVWVWLGPDEPPAPPRRIRGAQEYAWKQGSVDAKCSALLFLENMLDGAHPVFAHKGTHPAWFFHKLNGFKEYEYEVRVTDYGYALFYPATPSPDAPIPDDADSFTTFELPDRVTVLQKGAATDFYNVLHMVPTGPGTCRIEWMSRKRGDRPCVEWVPLEPKTLEQDRVLQESAQLNYARAGADFERSVPADYATLLTRKILKLAQAGRWDSGRQTLVQRKLVLVRQ